MKRRSFLKTTALGAVSISMYPFNACDSRIDRFSNGKYCIQPASDIPVIAEVDVLVAGGTIGGVSAACTAARSGSDVFLAGSSPYLGEDICGTCKFMFDSLEEGSSELSKKLFGNDSVVSPMYVKTLLEKELIDNNVRFLYCSYVSDVIFGDDNQPAGILGKGFGI